MGRRIAVLEAPSQLCGGVSMQCVIHGHLLFEQLPVGVRVPFFAGFVPIRGAEGSPGRMFALIEEEE